MPPGLTSETLVATAAYTLAGVITAHPLRGQGYEHDAPLLPAEYVTTDQGTGFVHTAPAHGEEDFALGREYGLEVPEAVLADGAERAREIASGTLVEVRRAMGVGGRS